MKIDANELYNTVGYFDKFRFPLRRHKKTVRTFLNEVYTEYKTDITTLPYLTIEDKTMITEFCNSIIATLERYDTNDMIKSYTIFYSIMEKSKNNLWRAYLEDTFSLDNGYYRVRRSKANDNFNELDLLHCPFNKRQNISGARFSLSGIPSTYLSTMPDLAWYEMDLPEDYHLARYTVNPNFVKKYALLYLDINPLWWSRKLKKDVTNNENSDNIVREFIDIARMFPLLMACSVVVENKSAAFKEEYIIPQMLMSWIRQSEDFLGIRYNTAVKYEAAENYSAHNVVIPTRDIDTDGYCKTLKSIFIHDKKTIIKHINASVALSEFDDKIFTLNEYYYDVKYQMQTSKVPLPYDDILKICQTILLNWDAIRTNYSVSAYTSLQTIKNLGSILQDMTRKFRELYGDDLNNYDVAIEFKPKLTQQIINEVQSTLQQFMSIVVHTVFELNPMIYKMNMMNEDVVIQ